MQRPPPPALAAPRSLPMCLHLSHEIAVADACGARHPPHARGSQPALHSSCGPTRAALDPLGSWALLYTLPGKPKGDVERSALQQAMAASYDVFYK
jgi:hypothetical protein